MANAFMNRNAINISKCTDIINRLLLHHCPRLNDSYEYHILLTVFPKKRIL